MKTPHVTILQTSFAKREDTIEFLKKEVPGVRVEFITDSTLLADVRAAGGPDQAIYDRMALYARAAEISGADLIINSCSTVGEVAEAYAKEVSIPVLRIDEPMCREAASCGNRFAVIGTVETSMGPVARLIERICQEEGRQADCRLFVQNEAWEALQAGSPAEHNQIVMENIRGLDAEGYDAIVMSQVSMRALLPELKDLKTPVLCSFFSGYGEAARMLREIAAQR